MRELDLVIEILQNLYEALGDGEIDPYLLTSEAYENVEQPIFNQIFQMMVSEDLIDGVELVNYEGSKMLVSRNKAKITLHGLEYLCKHSGLWRA